MNQKHITNEVYRKFRKRYMSHYNINTNRLTTFRKNNSAEGTMFNLVFIICQF